MSRAGVATGGLVALLVVDVVLVALALSPRSDSGDQGSVRIVESPTAPPSETPPAESPSPTSEAPSVAAPLVRLLDASSATQAWRLETGSCPDGGGSVQRTGDAGQTWADVAIEQDAFVRLKADGADEAFVVAVSDDGCTPVFFDTADGGTWSESAGSLSAAWYVEPVDRTAVHSPVGTQAGPCGADVVDLAAVTSDLAGLLCPDGRVFVTTDGAVSWEERVAVPGAVALSDAGDGFVVAVLGAQGCPGVQVVAAGTGTAEALGCADVSGEAGRLAISASGESVWLWAGDEVRVSGDGGRTWG